MNIRPRLEKAAGDLRVLGNRAWMRTQHNVPQSFVSDATITPKDSGGVFDSVVDFLTTGINVERETHNPQHRPWIAQTLSNPAVMAATGVVVGLAAAVCLGVSGGTAGVLALSFPLSAMCMKPVEWLSRQTEPGDVAMNRTIENVKPKAENLLDSAKPRVESFLERAKTLAADNGLGWLTSDGQNSRQ